METYTRDVFYNEIEVQDDISSWNEGDEIVITSTDFKWTQVEKFIVISAEGTTLKFYGKVENVHYGDSYEGIDMYAEIGLLTRNIKIHGEMESDCDGVFCDKEDYDKFGGHTKAVNGFKSYNIEGVELFHMGQEGILGRYPIHFHMAYDTMRDGKRSYIKNNAIHHTFR